MLNPLVTKHIEQGEDEIEVEISFDFQPDEPMTRHYPGCSASLDIYEVKLVETGAEICFLKDFESSMEEELLCEHYEDMKSGGDEPW